MSLQRTLPLLLLLATSAMGQIRVNVGGPQYTDPSSVVWAADYGCTSTGTYTYPSTISGTTSQTLYQTGRTATSSLNCTYTVPANSYYIVTLKFAEYNPSIQVGQRLMNVFVNNVRYYTALDVRSVCGFAYACDETPNPIAVGPEGSISITITQQQGQPMLAALQIVSLSTALGNVTLSGIPTIGQIPTATSPTTATWQTGGGGGGGTSGVNGIDLIATVGLACNGDGVGGGTDDTAAFQAAITAAAPYTQFVLPQTALGTTHICNIGTINFHNKVGLTIVCQGKSNGGGSSGFQFIGNDGDIWLEAYETRELRIRNCAFMAASTPVRGTGRRAQIAWDVDQHNVPGDQITTNNWWDNVQVGWGNNPYPTNPVAMRFSALSTNNVENQHISNSSLSCGGAPTAPFLPIGSAIQLGGSSNQITDLFDGTGNVDTCAKGIDSLGSAQWTLKNWEFTTLGVMIDSPFANHITVEGTREEAIGQIFHGSGYIQFLHNAFGGVWGYAPSSGNPATPAGEGAFQCSGPCYLVFDFNSESPPATLGGGAAVPMLKGQVVQVLGRNQTFDDASRASVGQFEHQWDLIAPSTNTGVASVGGGWCNSDCSNLITLSTHTGGGGDHGGTACAYQGFNNVNKWMCSEDGGPPSPALVPPMTAPTSGYFLEQDNSAPSGVYKANWHSLPAIPTCPQSGGNVGDVQVYAANFTCQGHSEWQYQVIGGPASTPIWQMTIPFKTTASTSGGVFAYTSAFRAILSLPSVSTVGVGGTGLVAGIEQNANSDDVTFGAGSTNTKNMRWHSGTGFQFQDTGGTYHNYQQVLSALSPSIGGGALLAGACASNTVTVTGATTSMTAAASPAAGVDPTGGGTLGVAVLARVSAADTVTVSVCPTIAGTPTAATYEVTVFVP